MVCVSSLTNQAAIRIPRSSVFVCPRSYTLLSARHSASTTTTLPTMSQVSASVSLRSGDVLVVSREPLFRCRTPSNSTYRRGVGDRTTISLETYLTSKSSVTERLASGDTASPQEALSRLQAKKRAVDALVQKVKGQ